MIIAIDRPLPAPLTAVVGTTIHLNPLLLLYGLPDLLKYDVHFFRHTSVDFYLQEVDGLISLVTYFEGLGWSEGLFSAQSSSVKDFDQPPAEQSQGYGAHLVLVNLPSQMVKAQRMIGWSNEFSRGLYDLCNAWKDAPALSDAEFNKRAAALMQRFPEPESLVRTAQYHYHQPRNV